MDKKEKFLQGFNEYKNIHEYFEENFNNFLNSVCEELVSYYGEEYKDIITYRLYNTNFVFYVNEAEPLFKSYIGFLDKGNLTDNYIIIKKQYKSITNLFKKVKNHVDNLNADDSNIEILRIFNRKIYEKNSNTYTEKDNAKRESTLSYLVKHNAICYLPIHLEEANVIEHNVLVPLFKTNDNDLIHEIIHAIMCQDLLLINGEEPYCKTGLSVRKDAEGLLEECITEIEAEKISKNLKDNGIELIEKYYPKKDNNPCFYNRFIPFIEEFYNYFKDTLIYSRITLNKSYLLEQIDRDNYYDFMVEFAKCYRDYFDNNDFHYYKNIFEKETKKMKDSYSVLRLK